MSKIWYIFLFCFLPDMRKPEMGSICPNSTDIVLATGTKISLQSKLHKHRQMSLDNFLK